MVWVGVLGGIGYWRFLFVLICDYFLRFELFIKLCIVVGFVVLCWVEYENGEEFEDFFDVGGSYEVWIMVIEVIEIR